LRMHVAIPRLGELQIATRRVDFPHSVAAMFIILRAV